MAASQKFSREHFVELGKRSAAARKGGIVLSAEEAARLAAAYALLKDIADRARRAAARSPRGGDEGEAGEGQL